MSVPPVQRILAPVPGTAAGSAPVADGRDLIARSQVGVDVLELYVEVLSQSEDASGELFYDRLCEAVCRLAHMRRALIFRYDSARRRGRGGRAEGESLPPP